jgi:hypothetical protein
MKTNISKLALLTLSASLTFSACQKETMHDASTSFGMEDAIIILESTGYETKIITPLEKPADYDFITKGVIQYTINGKEEATFDFGNGEKDTWASNMALGKFYPVDLTHKGKGKKSCYDKIIVNPLVKTMNCKYIVQGTIEYWKDGKWEATVDYGDGTCDDLATKKWNGGSKVFSLASKK